MALVLGTNCGFVTTAPTADPGGSAVTADNNSFVTKDTTPSGDYKITEIGWWCNNATQESNFEIGLYAADGAVVPGEAGTLLEVARTNAKGTTSGWKTVSVDWSISPSTVYWLSFQLDNTVAGTSTDVTFSGANGYDNIGGISTLPNPYGGGAIGFVTGVVAIYALIEESSDPTIQGISSITGVSSITI